MAPPVLMGSVVIGPLPLVPPSPSSLLPGAPALPAPGPGCVAQPVHGPQIGTERSFVRQLVASETPTTLGRWQAAGGNLILLPLIRKPSSASSSSGIRQLPAL